MLFKTRGLVFLIYFFLPENLSNISSAARAVGIFGGSLDLPIILWGMTTSIEFKDDSRYPTTVSAVGNSERTFKRNFFTIILLVVYTMRKK